MAKSSIAMSENEIEQMEASMLGTENEEDTAAIETVTEPAVSDRKGKAKETEYEFEGPRPEADDTAEQAAAGDKKKQAKKPEQQGAVPHEAFHAEREGRKQAQQALEQERIRVARMEERLNGIQTAIEQRQREAAQQQTQQQQPDQMPDAEADPMGAIAWMQRQEMRRQQAEAQQRQQGQQYQAQNAEQQRQAQEFNTAYTAVTTYWNQRKAEDPTIDEAYNYMRQSYVGELQALGYVGIQLEQELNNIEARHIMNCFRSGQPIDKLVVGLAQTRGWKPKSEEELEQAKAEVDKGTKTLDRLAAAKDASTTLGTSGGGKTGGNKLSLEALDRMPQKEFNQLIASLSRRGDSAVDDALARMEGI